MLNFAIVILVFVVECLVSHQMDKGNPSQPSIKAYEEIIYQAMHI